MVVTCHSCGTDAKAQRPGSSVNSDFMERTGIKLSLRQVGSHSKESKDTLD